MTAADTHLVVRVTHHTWHQHPVSRHRSRNLAETAAAFRTVFAYIAALGNPHHTYQAWKETP